MSYNLIFDEHFFVTSGTKLLHEMSVVDDPDRDSIALGDKRMTYPGMDVVVHASTIGMSTYGAMSAWVLTM